MYLPYLRGKQNELLALRELAMLPLIGSKISPIIEPIKKDLKGVETALKALSPAGIDLQLILNPEYGDLKRNYQPVQDSLTRFFELGLTNVIPTYLIATERDYAFFRANSAANGHLESGYSLIILNQINSATELRAIANDSNLKFNLIQVNHLVSLARGFSVSSLGFLADRFVKKRRNVDYLDSEDEIYSSDCFYYK